MTKEIQDTLNGVEPANRWMHGYTNSGHPTCCAVALKNLEIIEREGLVENSAKMGNVLLAALQNVFADHPDAGDIRGGKGLIAAVEVVEDRASERNFAIEKRFGARLHLNATTRSHYAHATRGGEHPAPGDQVRFAPPLTITEEEKQYVVLLCLLR